jgi:hypothetical protein
MFLLPNVLKCALTYSFLGQQSAELTIEVLYVVSREGGVVTERRGWEGGTSSSCSGVPFSNLSWQTGYPDRVA